MNKQLVTGIVLTAFLAACSSTQVKEEPKAAVEDKSPVTKVEPKPAEPVKTAEPAPTTAPITEASTSINPLKDPNNILSKRSIYFDYDKDDIKAEFRPLLEAHAKYLTSHADAKIAVQGNTDERGSREYNLALGQRRSVAVKKVLNVLGVGDKQIETVSYGEEKPQSNGHDEAAWAQNRRADIIYEGE